MAGMPFGINDAGHNVLAASVDHPGSVGQEIGLEKCRYFSLDYSNISGTRSLAKYHGSTLDQQINPVHSNLLFVLLLDRIPVFFL
jgi:hypothetical protein